MLDMPDISVVDSERKVYIPDSSVIFHDPTFPKYFKENDIHISAGVFGEVDRKKTEPGFVGESAREFSRYLEALSRNNGKLSEGVVYSTEGGRFFLDYEESMKTPYGLRLFDLGSTDIGLIVLATYLKEVPENKGKKVVIVSKDRNLRTLAREFGAIAEDYKTDRVEEKDIYTGILYLDETLEDGMGFMDKMHFKKLKKRAGKRAKDQSEQPIELYKNQYFVDKTGDVYRERAGRICRISEPRSYKIKPRNHEQFCALDALLDPEIQLVTLFGAAGTGKTLLAIDAGVKQIFSRDKKSVYDRFHISRPIVPMGNDIGFLPGREGDKLDPWIRPIKDSFLVIGSDVPKDKFDGGYQRIHKTSKSRNPLLEELQSRDLIEIEALTYIRGRSIPNQYIIIDEAQNLTPHEVKTILTRASEGTKVILTGDLYQIDRRFLDASSNGLSYVIGRFKGYSGYANIGFRDVVRSRLAAEAAKRL